MTSATEQQLLVEAFVALTRTIPADEVMFGSPSLQVAGICDGTRGVQWNTWIEWDDDKQMAYAGVNLEGIAYDDWPVARFIERELASPRLFDAAVEVGDPHLVEVFWIRDAWQVQAHPPIREKWIGHSPRLLHALTPSDWTSMLQEAYDCLDATRGHRGRAQQRLTTPAGEERIYSVSPHFQLRQAFWPRSPQTVAGWRASLDEAMENLRPLHRVVSEQARA
jgi:hypothetical protein